MVALTDARNLPCVALLESAGLYREGHFRQNGWYTGEWCDEYQFAMLGAEWAARWQYPATEAMLAACPHFIPYPLTFVLSSSLAFNEKPSSAYH